MPSNGNGNRQRAKPNSAVEYSAMSKDEMIEWFKSAPMGSRQQRMLWSAHKIARLTGATDAGAYRTLESALIEAERLDVTGDYTA
jgi:hypothetical protein